MGYNFVFVNFVNYFNKICYILMQIENPKAIICPSILSCNFADIGSICQKLIDDGSDWIHLDIMVNSSNFLCLILHKDG